MIVSILICNCSNYFVISRARSKILNDTMSTRMRHKSSILRLVYQTLSCLKLTPSLVLRRVICIYPSTLWSTTSPYWKTTVRRRVDTSIKHWNVKKLNTCHLAVTTFSKFNRLIEAFLRSTSI